MILHVQKYCNMFIFDDPLLKGSINNIRDVDKYEGTDEADDINRDALNDID